MIRRLARGRSARVAAVLLLSGALAACATPSLEPPARPEVLLEQFRSGDVRLDCARCRYDYQGAEWMLEDGHYEPLVLGILRSRDGSGRSWYLLGRVAEATGSPELAIRYYRESMATPRQPIVALWPLYEDVNYRMRRLMSQPPPAPERPRQQETGPIEKVNVESVVVGTRPGSIGAFMEKLGRGDAVEVLDRSGDWKRIRIADGRVGWVFGDYVSASGEPPAPRRVARKPAKPKPVARKSSPRPKRAASPPAEPAREVAESRAVAPASVPGPPTAPVRVDVRRPVAALPLVAGASVGLQDCPLPLGASLAGRSHGAAGVDDHPTETYAIEAPASEIVGFYEREMQQAGWSKTLVSSELLLYFVRDDETVGVLIDREGGSFTLMGS